MAPVEQAGMSRIATERGRGRRIAFWLIMLAIPLAFLEALGFAATRFAPDLFDQREAVLSSLRPDAFERFREASASSALGWDNPTGITRREPNCAGVEITYTYDQDRLRVHAAGSTPDAAVVVTGDSYTEGAEVAADETFPAVLQRMLGVPVANLGVGGYGPDQALLKLEGLIDRFPKARVLVLAVMYRDAQRMLNSYRPVLIPSTGIRFGLKPHVRDGAFAPIPGGDPYRDFSAMLAAADGAFDHDFWRRPRAHFPYSVALVRAALAPSVWYPALNRVLTSFGWPRERLAYALPQVRDGLRTVYDRFARLAQARNLVAVIAFIPFDGADRTSGEDAIAAATPAQRNAIVFLNVGRDFDWAHFNGPTCHPNASGYRMIAADVARAVRPLLGGPP
jgi:lysophospholipase L1-like esterase